MSEALVKQYGDYKNLFSYRKADVIYQLTYYFCETYMNRSKDRSVDQMVQAARSGKQNISEGYTDFATSMKTGIHLVNVAKGSLIELKEDYIDYLRTRGLKQWEPHSEQVAAMKHLASVHNDAEYYLKLAQTRSDETIANMAICLLEQTDYLLYKLLAWMSAEFENNGGFTERMYNWRKKSRGDEKK